MLDVRGVVPAPGSKRNLDLVGIFFRDNFGLQCLGCSCYCCIYIDYFYQSCVIFSLSNFIVFEMEIDYCQYILKIL